MQTDLFRQGGRTGKYRNIHILTEVGINIPSVFDDHFFYTESFFQVFPYFQSDGAGYGTHRADTACLGYPRHLFEYAGSIPACLKGG